MNGYFIAIIVMNVLSLGIYLGKHGEPREGTYNFWIAVISVVITLTLTYFAIKAGF